MFKPVFSIVSGLTMATAVLAQGSGPQITATFPPAQDLRKPDLTIRVADSGPVSAATYNANGRFLATAGPDYVIKLWDTRPGEEGTGALIRSFQGHTGRVLAIAPGQAANTLVSIGADQTVRTWDENSGRLIRTTSFKIDAGVRQVAVRPGKEPILAIWSGHVITLSNYETERVVKTFELRGEHIRSLAFSPDGKRFAAGTGNGEIQLWDAEAGRPIRSVKRPIGAVNTLAYDYRGEQLATAGPDKTVKVWDLQTDQLLCIQEGHTAEVLAMAFSSNGQKMASAGADGTARTWTVPLPPLPPATLASIAAAVPAKASAAPQRSRRILVIWRADAILHKGGVPAVNHAIETMSRQTGAFEADFTRDAAAFDPAVLSKYDAIVMNSTAHLILDEAQRRAYLDYARGGGGVVGIHAAMDMFLRWPEGAKVIGATFGDHPWGPNGTWAVRLDEPEHPLLRAFGRKHFTIRDEFYVMGEPYSRADRRVLMSVDLSDPTTGAVNLAANPARSKDHDFALAWIKKYGAGRVFYADFGHIADPLARPEVVQFYLDGIQYVLGDLEADDSPR